MEAGQVPAAVGGGEGDGGRVPEQGAGLDLSPVLDRMEQLADQIGQMGGEPEQEPFQQGPWQPQPQQPSVYGGMYGQPPQQQPFQPQAPQFGPGQQPQFQQQPGFGQAPVPGMPPVVDEYGQIDPNMLGAYMQSLPQLTAQGVMPQVQQMLQPVLEHMQRQDQVRQMEEQDRGFERVETEFPALKEEKAAQAAVSRAAEVAASLGLDPRQQAANPGFVRLIYASDLAAQQQQNGGAGQQPDPGVPELEQGGGATPGGSNGNSWVAHVQGRRQDSAVQDFWGVPVT